MKWGCCTTCQIPETYECKVCFSALDTDLLTVSIGLMQHTGWTATGRKLGCLCWQSLRAIELLPLQALFQCWLWQRAICLRMNYICALVLLSLWHGLQMLAESCHYLTCTLMMRLACTAEQIDWNQEILLLEWKAHHGLAICSEGLQGAILPFKKLLQLHWNRRHYWLHGASHWYLPLFWPRAASQAKSDSICAAHDHIRLTCSTSEAEAVSDQILVENDVSALAEASALAWFDDIIDCCLMQAICGK